MNHSPTDYDRLYAFSREVLTWHKLAERPRRCALVIIEYSFALHRPAAIIPTLDQFTVRAGTGDKSHTLRVLKWLDLVGVARCFTDRGLYLFKPDYRRWNHDHVPLWWAPEQWRSIHEQLVLIPADPTLDDALASISRDAVLQSLAGSGALPPVDGASTNPSRPGRATMEAPVGGTGASFDSRCASPLVAGPATTARVFEEIAVAGPATGIVNNSLARASGEPEPVTGKPVCGELPEPVSVAGPATAPSDADDVLRRIGKVCGRAELSRNTGRWITAYRTQRRALLHALEDTELQAARGFYTSAGAFLNRRFNDYVAGRAPRWRQAASATATADQPKETHSCPPSPL